MKDVTKRDKTPCPRQTRSLSHGSNKLRYILAFPTSTLFPFSSLHPAFIGTVSCLDGRPNCSVYRLPALLPSPNITTQAPAPDYRNMAPLPRPKMATPSPSHPQIHAWRPGRSGFVTTLVPHPQAISQEVADLSFGMAVSA